MSPECSAYRVVFDVSAQMPGWWFPAFGLVPALFALILVIVRLVPAFAPLLTTLRISSFRGMSASSTRLLTLAIAAIIFVGSLAWTALASFLVFRGWYTAKTALESGMDGVVTGRVDAFHAMDVHGHDTEHFTVKGIYFAYSDFILDSAFNNTSTHGGPMAEGKEVRLHYLPARDHARIIKLEICEDEQGSLPGNPR